MERITTASEFLEPSAAVCLGREAECESLSQIPCNEGVGFLFGGRQMGKTTVLLKVRDNLVAQLATKPPILVVPVYVNRKALPPLDDRGLCNALLSEAVRCLALHVAIDHDRGKTDCSTVLELASEFDRLFAATENLSLRLLFLLDDCKKLAKLHPNFLGNLQWLLCNRSSKYRSRISMIFAGGQEMYSLLLDEISPPRPALVYLGNLDLDHLEELVSNHPVHVVPACRIKELAARIHGATGGHPGLSRNLLEEIARAGAYSANRLGDAIRRFAEAKQGFFDRMRSDLSPEAACVQPLMSTRRTVSRSEVLAFVQRAGQSQYKSGRFLPELRFTGLTRNDSRELSAVGQLYWEYCAQFAPPSQLQVASPTEEKEFLFRKEGAGWVLAFNGKRCYAEDGIGLSRIHRLIENPGKWISAVVLAQEQEVECGQAKKNERQAQDLAGETEDRSGSAIRMPRGAKQLNVDDIIDPEAEKQVRQEIQALEAEVAELENAPDTEDSLLDEKKYSLNELKRYLASAARAGAPSPGGSKSRKFANHDERARKAVSKSISEAVVQIRSGGLHELADHLHDFIRYERYEYAYLAGNATSKWKL